MDSARKGVFVSVVDGWKLFFSENHAAYEASNINALNVDIGGLDDMEGEMRYLLFRLDEHVGFW